METDVRFPAVCGTFYPQEATALEKVVTAFLSQATVSSRVFPKAVIVPHAGYVYSGAVAAHAYAELQKRKGLLKRIVLVGPSHHVGFQGIAASQCRAFLTPFGEIPLDTTAIQSLVDTFPAVFFSNQAHAAEHSLETQLPFLQTILGSFTLIPLLASSIAPETVASVLDFLWAGEETAIVISSDLSHYHPYEKAQQRDRTTTQAIEELDYQTITGHDACGCYAVNGLLYLAKQKGLSVQTLALCNSGDVSGDKTRVVGYGTYLIGKKR